MVNRFLAFLAVFSAFLAQKPLFFSNKTVTLSITVYTV